MAARTTPAQRMIPEILTQSKTIAVVGCSRTAGKDAHDIPAYMQAHGYKLVPINPSATEILGEPAHPSLLELPVELKVAIDIIDVFRPSAEVSSIVDQAIQLKNETRKSYVVWTQLGIRDDVAAEKARTAGLEVVQARCLKVEHAALGILKNDTS